jgi:hypothetical protein
MSNSVEISDDGFTYTPSDKRTAVPANELAELRAYKEASMKWIRENHACEGECTGCYSSLFHSQPHEPDCSVPALIRGDVPA